jgi:S-DNA-T family DNA segregation ATPase FtsK/SpoIIIE
VPRLSPDVTRSLVAVVLMVLGAVILIGLVFQGRGALTDWILHVIAPWFGSGRWLLPFILIGLGVWLERAGGVRAGWPRTLLGSAIAYVAALALIALLADAGVLDGRSGGDIGRWLGTFVSGLVSSLGAFVVFVGVLLAGLVVALDRPVRDLLAPFGRGARDLGNALAAPAASAGAAAIEQARRPRADAPAAPGSGTSLRDGRSARDVGVSPGQTHVWGANGETVIPALIPSQSQVSSTFAPPRGVATPAPPVVPAQPTRDPNDVTDRSDSPPTRNRIEYVLPPMTTLEEVVVPPHAGGEEALHVHNERTIERKLNSFGISARIIGRNAGPVVTQYEVQPDEDVKVSRIEALSDDLAMALAARSLRIEAPIPGKNAVGIEIPNRDFNIVGLRRIFEEVDFKASGSTLTFALGRDVAGKAQAVDLAKMPHLLIAGATGSGKSVMVNALITSLLFEATPDDLRMILVDLKRVELAAYNGLPHLLVPVITEPERAKAALKWAVNEMEARYRRLAGATARNIRMFNDTRADPADRMPYIVVIVDELADLMMREGKNVEDSIVRLAQKARATGIHLVLATQRPSVNVVTGLIKANFPSRIAFAMASQIDSRTILDAPGAEDLIGRGDMLYQPSDLPRPMRLQGVFVSDAEISRVVEHWRAQIDNPHYDMGIIEDAEDSTGSVDDLADDDADRLLRDAVGVVQEYDRASASLLQRRLKIGYARAARIIDQLEERGYIGAFDGSNARQVLRREAGRVVAPPDADDGDGR